ncbi:MAG: hypothetical protein ACREVT_02485, partial [Burkholderiales bacterium]
MSYAPRPCRNHTVGRWTVHPDWFAGLGLLADRNATVMVAMAIGALSVSAAIFLILELDTAYEGV